MNARRFEYINWVPTKIDVPVVVGDEPFLLDDYLAEPRSANEELLPEDEEPRFQADEGIVGQLEAMGFPRMRAEKALYHTGNKDPEAAMNWLFAHMDDPDIDAPMSFAPKGSAGAEPDEEKVSMLGAMGFTAGQAKKALKETGGDVERAVEWLFSHPDDMGDDEVMRESVDAGTPRKEPGRGERPAQFELYSIVCHKGSSIHAGHYVAFIRKEVEGEGKVWVLFNDEKVVKASDVGEMKKFA